MIHLKRLIFLLLYLLVIGCQVNILNKNINIKPIEYQQNNMIKK